VVSPVNPVEAGVRQVALFLTKLCSRVIRTDLQALDVRLAAQASLPLQRAFAAVDAATAAIISNVGLVA